MGSTNELFWVGSRLAFETGHEPVGVILQRAALGRKLAFAFLQATLPDGRCCLFHVAS
ncbi:hypothetical protein D3C80_844140 [compost metagenome]